MTKSMFPVPRDAAAPGASDVKWFAGLAMQAIIARQPTVPETESEREEIALWSYRMAQAMVAAEARLHIDEGSTTAGRQASSGGARSKDASQD